MAGNRRTEPGAKNHAWPETWWKSSHLKILKWRKLAWGGGCGVCLGGGQWGRMARGLPSRALHTSSSSNNPRGCWGWQAWLLALQSKLGGWEGGSQDQAFPEHWLLFSQTR